MSEKILTSWIKVPNHLLKSDSVSPIEALVYSVLLDHSDEALNVKISQRQIAEDLNITIRTVINALQNLEKENWVQKHETQKKGGMLIYHLREIIPSKNKRKSKKKDDETDYLKEYVKNKENNFDDMK